MYRIDLSFHVRLVSKLTLNLCQRQNDDTSDRNGTTGCAANDFCFNCQDVKLRAREEFDDEMMTMGVAQHSHSWSPINACGEKCLAVECDV